MSPVTHALVSWAVANASPLGRKDRAIVTALGVIPDIDGLSGLAVVLSRADAPMDWWSRYHHVLCHNLGFAIISAVGAWLQATRRWVTAGLGLLAFHAHLLCDILGSRGPDGYQWPIPYLLPFSSAWQITWSGHWALNAWQNFAVTGVFLALAFYLAWRRGFSPVGIFSARADQSLVLTLRRRFGSPRSEPMVG